MKNFSGIMVYDGEIRRVCFEASDSAEAQRLAKTLNVGYQGETDINATPLPLPEGYNEEDARFLLGKISRTTLYRMLIRGDVERAPGTRKVVVTRASIERYGKKRK